MAQYDYPKLSPGWDYWILQQKIFDALGTRPDANDWFSGFSGDRKMVTVHTDRELSQEEKAKLDAVMSDPGAGLYPSSREGFTVFQIDDVYDSWGRIERACGVKIRYVFANVPFHDRVELWLEGSLSDREKGKVLREYAKLISEKS